MAPTPFTHPIVIIGGGMVGLTLAQALKKADIPCTVFERDNGVETERGGGWAITIHWALKALEDCLPADLFARLADIQVDPEQGIKDTGRFLFLNLRTLEPKYEIPPSKRMRVNRRLLRLLLAEGLEIRYGMSLTRIESDANNDTTTVHFDDGTTATSNLIIACDGSNSRTRHLLFQNHPTSSELNQLPVSAMGLTIRLTPSQIQPLRQIDPLLFQGCHPLTGVFLWYSTVSTPPLNGSEKSEDPYYEGQLIMSWRHRSPTDDVPPTPEERLQMMRRLATPFHRTLRNAIEAIPARTEIKEIRLQDWPSQSWPNHDGRVTLAGDAAHAMTMYRGEAFNHGVTDAANLANLLTRVRNGELPLPDATATYESELLARTHDAVLLSRQACLDAHDYENLHPDSPLVSKRARVLESAREISTGTPTSAQ